MIISKEKHAWDKAVRWFFIVAFFASFAASLSGCAQLDKMYDKDGNLTPYAQAITEKGNAVVNAVEAIAPAPYNGIVGGIAGFAMGAVVVFGGVYRKFKPKESIA